MTPEEQDRHNHREMSLLYEGLIHLMNLAETSPQEALAVLVKVAVLTALASGEDKQGFLDKVGCVWDYENFNQPDSKEIN
jgi:hypothetical protein